MKMVRVNVRHDTTVVMVGDSKVGKSSLVNKFRTGKFDASYTRTGFETLTTSTVLQGTRVKFTIYDTTGTHAHIISYELAPTWLVPLVSMANCHANFGHLHCP